MSGEFSSPEPSSEMSEMQKINRDFIEGMAEIEQWEKSEAERIKNALQAEKLAIQSRRKSRSAMEEFIAAAQHKHGLLLNDLRKVVASKKRALIDDKEFRIKNIGKFNQRMDEMQKLTADDILIQLDPEDLKRLEQKYKFIDEK